MATYHGNSGVVEVTAGPVGEVTAFTVNTRIDTVDATAMGATWKTHETGVKSWDGTIECFLDDTDTTQSGVTEGSEISVTLYPRGSDSGAEEITGTATVTEVSKTVNKESINAVTFSYTGKGAVTVGDAT